MPSAGGTARRTAAASGSARATCRKGAPCTRPRFSGKRERETQGIGARRGSGGEEEEAEEEEEEEVEVEEASRRRGAGAARAEEEDSSARAAAARGEDMPTVDVMSALEASSQQTRLFKVVVLTHLASCPSPSN